MKRMALQEPQAPEAASGTVHSLGRAQEAQGLAHQRREEARGAAVEATLRRVWWAAEVTGKGKAPARRQPIAPSWGCLENETWRSGYESGLRPGTGEPKQARDVSKVCRLGTAVCENCRGTRWSDDTMIAPKSRTRNAMLLAFPRVRWQTRYDPAAGCASTMAAANRGAAGNTRAGQSGDPSSAQRLKAVPSRYMLDSKASTSSLPLAPNNGSSNRVTLSCDVRIPHVLDLAHSTDTVVRVHAAPSGLTSCSRRLLACARTGTHAVVHGRYRAHVFSRKSSVVNQGMSGSVYGGCRCSSLGNVMQPTAPAAVLAKAPARLTPKLSFHSAPGTSVVCCVMNLDDTHPHTCACVSQALGIQLTRAPSTMRTQLPALERHGEACTLFNNATEVGCNDYKRSAAVPDLKF